MPQGWQLSSIGDSAIIANLPLSGTKWVSALSFCDEHSFFAHVRQFASQRSIFLHCGKHFAGYLANFHYDKLFVGSEARLVIHPYPRWSKSLQLLRRRAAKHGSVFEEPHSLAIEKTIEELRKKSKNGNKPQLRRLFRTIPDADTRIFMFLSNADIPLACITVSMRNQSSAALELMIRDVKAPIGIMEDLICTTTELLANEGVLEFSLGAVPFTDSSKIENNYCVRIGKLFGNIYNFDGLFQFKNKFAPNWEPLYVCCPKKVNPIYIAELFFVCNFFSLLVFESTKKILDFVHRQIM